MNTEKIGYCGQVSNHFDFAFPLGNASISKTDPFLTWDQTDIIDYYFSLLGEDYISDVEYGLYLAINYARSFTKHYEAVEVSNNPWLSEFLKSWPSYNDATDEYTLKQFHYSEALKDLARHLAYHESVCMNQH